MSILVTYAVSLLIEGALNMIFSVNDVQLQGWYVNRAFAIGSVHFGYIYVAGFVLAVGLLSSLYFMLYRTRFGVSVRASLADQTSAALVGIDVKRVSTICFGIGVAVTAAGGMIYGATNSFNASTSYDLISRLLTIIVLVAWVASGAPCSRESAWSSSVTWSASSGRRSGRACRTSSCWRSCCCSAHKDCSASKL